MSFGVGGGGDGGGTGGMGALNGGIAEANAPGTSIVRLQNERVSKVDNVNCDCN